MPCPRRRSHRGRSAPLGPKQPRSTGLTPAQEATGVAFRTHTVLPLDDGLYARQPSLPALPRSALQRLVQRHDISRLPEMDGAHPAKKKFKQYPIGYVHLDIAEVRTEEGKLYLFVAIDRTSTFAYVELQAQYGKMEAAQFLRNLIAAVPDTLHTLRTDTGIQFTTRNTDRQAFPHIVARVCLENDTEHRLTQPNHPWTTGQVERMNRTLKEATVKRDDAENHQQLREHRHHFMNAYNFAKRLNARQGRTPSEYILKTWQNKPHRFLVNPPHHKRRTKQLEADNGDCGKRVVRGGSWSSDPLNLLASSRYETFIGNQGDDLGFRLVQDIP